MMEVKFCNPLQNETKAFLGYGYSVRIGYCEEANKRLDPIAYLYNGEELWKIYRLKVLFLIVKTVNVEYDEDIGLIAVEDGGKDKVFIDFGEHVLLTPYELDDIATKLVKEGFRIHFVF